MTGLAPALWGQIRPHGQASNHPTLRHTWVAWLLHQLEAGMGGAEEGDTKGARTTASARPGTWPGCSAVFLSSALAVCGRGFAPTPQALTSIWGKHHASLGVPGLEGNPASCPGPGADRRADRQTDGVGLGHPSHGLEEGAGSLENCSLGRSPAQCWGGPAPTHSPALTAHYISAGTYLSPR